MSVIDLSFYALCAVMLGLAALTATARNLFRSALSLLGVLLCTAVLFLSLRAEMVALVQVMVYIGGIMIFVLYAVLLTSELGGKMPAPSPVKIIFGLIVAAVALGSLASLAQRTGHAAMKAGSAAASASGTGTGGNIAAMKSLGERLLDPQGFLVGRYRGF